MRVLLPAMVVVAVSCTECEDPFPPPPAPYPSSELTSLRISFRLLTM